MGQRGVVVAGLAAVVVVLAVVSPVPAAEAPGGEIVLLSYIPKDPVLVWDARVGNGGALFDAVVATVRRFAPPEERAKVDEQLAKMDEELGISLRSDLLAYLGPEVAFVFDMPPIDQAVGVAMSGDAKATASILEGVGLWCWVSDAKKVDRALRVLFAKGEARLRALDGGVVEVTFEEEKGAGDDRPGEAGPPPPPLFYALGDHLLTFAFSAERARSMLQARAAGETLADGADFARLRQYLDPHPSSLWYVNLPKLQGILKESTVLQAMLSSKEESRPFAEFLLDPGLAPMGFGATTIPVGEGTRQTSVGPSWMAGSKFTGAILASIAIPNLLNAIDRGRQKRTMADMQTLAAAMEAYRVDHDTYPDTGGWVDCEKLEGVLAPEYLRAVPATDGWGFELRCFSDGRHYRLVSPGKDGKTERSWSGEIEETKTSSFDRDIVFADGNFVVYPENIEE